MPTITVSLVILTYGREQLLRETIGDALAQKTAPHEVIVVDGTPEHEPETWRFLESVGERVRVIRQDRPGMTVARNMGIGAATGDIILFVDDDVVLPVEFVGAHVRNYSEPNVGAVAGRVHLSLTVSRPLLLAPPPTGSDFDLSVRKDVAFGRGCNLSFRRKALITAGLFDEAMTGHAAGEEEDACFAVRRQGYRIVFDPEAWLVHRYDPTGGSRALISDPGRDPTYYRNKVYFALKNVGSGDFVRLIWDTYKSWTLSPRARQAGLAELARRQLLFARGVVDGVYLFRHSGARRVPLPYRHP